MNLTSLFLGILIFLIGLDRLSPALNLGFELRGIIFAIVLIGILGLITFKFLVERTELVLSALVIFALGGMMFGGGNSFYNITMQGIVNVLLGIALIVKQFFRIPFVGGLP